MHKFLIISVVASLLFTGTSFAQRMRKSSLTTRNSVTKPSTHSSKSPSKNQSDSETKYTVTIRTGAIKKAGTDADVTLKFIGSKKNYSVKIKQASKKGLSLWCLSPGVAAYTLIHNATTDKDRGKLERSSNYSFGFSSSSLGKLKAIQVSHNNKGNNSGWYLDYVLVDSKKSGNKKRVLFPCHRWLSKADDDRKISRYLRPEKELVHYMVKVYTGSRAKSGTDARVRINVEGTTRNEVASWQLNSSGDPFEKGSIDKFNMFTRDLGDLKHLRISQDGSGKGSGWFLYKVLIYEAKRPSKQWKFTFDRWLDKKNGQTASKTLN